MNYVTGPFYGHYEKYDELLRLLNLGDEDTLTILGNAIGYDKNSMKLLVDLSYRSNIYLLLGKQEYLAKTLLPKLKPAGDINESILSLDDGDKDEFLQWVKIGGYEIAKSFFEMSAEEKEGVMDYLNDLEPFAELDSGKRGFVLAYSAPKGFEEGKDLYSYDDSDFALGETNYSKKYFSDKVFITACKSADKINDGDFGKIYSGKNRHISVATLDPSQGRSVALCLDNMKAVYGSFYDLPEA